MRDCPNCGSPVDGLVCAVCNPATKTKASEESLQADRARQRFIDHAPSSADLSAQAWYNVCKFYPSIAEYASKHSHRPLADVGPHNPLDKTARRGLFGLVLFNQLRRLGHNDDA